MRTITFVDAHVHLWDLDRLRYPWLTPPFGADGPAGSVEAIAQTYLPTHYRQESAGWTVAAYVHVDAGAVPGDAPAETEWLSGLEDGPTGIVAFAQLDAPDIDRQLAVQGACDRVRGIRQIVNWHPNPARSYTPRDVTRDEGWTLGFARLARHGFSFDLQCYPAQMPALAALAARHPDIPIVIDHLGMPVPSDPNGTEDWHTGLVALAACPNVTIKISGLGFIKRRWDVDDARPWILRAVDYFGPFVVWWLAVFQRIGCSVASTPRLTPMPTSWVRFHFPKDKRCGAGTQTVCTGSVSTWGAFHDAQSADRCRVSLDGGLASASFYVPYRSVRRWSWEIYWLTGGVFSWILAPWFFASIQTHDLLGVLASAPRSAILWPITFGLLWGFGGLTYGLTMRYLGLSLGMAVVLGLCTVFGTLIPPALPGRFCGQAARYIVGQRHTSGSSGDDIRHCRGCRCGRAKG